MIIDMTEKWRTKTFWYGLAERAFSTLWQTVIATVIAGGAATLSGVDWMNVIDVAALAVVLSVGKAFVVPDTTDTAVAQYHEE